LFAALLLGASSRAGSQPDSPPLQGDATPAQPAVGASDRTGTDRTGTDLARDLITIPTPERLRGWHDMVASEPHDAGTPGDARLIAAIAEAFTSFGLEVEIEEFEAYLGTPVSASVRVFAPDVPGSEGLSLSLMEPSVEGFSQVDPGLRPGWNAYSGSGAAEARVVYANYGRKEDFAWLRELGVDVRGAIVLARYGGNFRGYKARFAEEAGAAGLVIFTDPADDGWGRGIPRPEGGWADGGSIQRGSLKVGHGPGDALTPFEFAGPEARRLNPERAGLPTIPVQPIGWDAAREILSRMTGASVPEGWQGGLPLRYRLTGGEALRVRLEVQQTRGLVNTANVLGVLRGTDAEANPGQERFVVIGCHHDAWGYGAGDPGAGTICLIEAARAFGELASRGVRPRRSIVFAAWGAEEHGIVGSVEHVERRVRDISDRCVAYLNLDMAAMGPVFNASASPSLRSVIVAAAADVPQARDPGRTVLEAWTGGSAEPAFGTLGGGSDHVGFLCHTCVPSAGLGGGGSDGVSYHTAHDTLAWYRRVVGEDYEPAVMVTRMTLGVAARLAHEPILPLDPAAYLADVRAAAESLGAGTLADEAGGGVLLAPAWRAASAGASEDTIARVNAELMAIERAWCDGSFEIRAESDGGTPAARWYRNGFVSPDLTSGYAPWVLPGVRGAREAADSAREPAQVEAVRAWVRGARSRLFGVGGMLGQTGQQEVESRVPEPPAGQ
jgi:N-acetylated-alpha-linked acidic dipeptidase